MPEILQSPETEKTVTASDHESQETPHYRDIQRATRHGAKDYSHFSITYGVTLKTDSAQRFLENYFPRCDYNLKYLNYSLLWFKEDDTGKNYCQDIEKALSEYLSTMNDLTRKMYDMIKNNEDQLSVLGTPTYDNPRSYKHSITNSQSAQLLNCVVAMDLFFQALDLAYAKQLVQMFERQELMQYHVQRLRQIVRQIRTIRNDVMTKSQEMANERTKRLEKEAEEREKKRKKDEQERESALQKASSQTNNRKKTQKPVDKPLEDKTTTVQNATKPQPKEQLAESTDVTKGEHSSVKDVTPV